MFLYSEPVNLIACGGRESKDSHPEIEVLYNWIVWMPMVAVYSGDSQALKRLIL